MPRMTKAAVGRLLADFDAANRDKLKAETRVKELKAEIRNLNLKEGAYGEMTLAYSAGREILDQQKARELLKSNGVPVPTVMTTASIVVKPVVK
jgi:hypothetical protein